MPTTSRGLIATGWEVRPDGEIPVAAEDDADELRLRRTRLGVGDPLDRVLLRQFCRGEGAAVRLVIAPRSEREDQTHAADGGGRLAVSPGTSSSLRVFDQWTRPLSGN